MQQFYLIRDKVKKVINNDWNFSLFEKKSTRPKRIQYKYKKEYGTGIYEFYYLTKIGHFKYQDKTVKHNIKTLMNWNNIFNAKTSKYKNPAKHPRYEVEKLGKIQHDIKVLTKDLTGLDRNYYVFDFIDEKSRFAIGYIYDSKGVTNAIGATRKAIQRFADIGIKVTRIRTDNGTEYISNLHKHPTRKISEFTEFLNKKG
ncbi:MULTISPECIES: DDE-type integrase/transposase/recombinase [unclassified Spiroplasma]|uniref:DDE-type integrase/transposase/recombinase n=1 Tax=unclassified Spiroplasma TaxID=2637901 RepID=UPI0030CFF65E